jgi:hypothetical protein
MLAAIRRASSRGEPQFMSLGQTPDPIRIKPLTHFFSSFEGGNGFLCDWDDSSGTGVTPLARSPELSRKRSEIS